MPIAAPPPPAWAAHALVDRSLAAGQAPLEIWRAAGDDLEVGLAVAAHLLGLHDLDAADRLLAALAPADPGPRAVLVVLQQRLLAARDLPIDRAALEQALPHLLADARWPDALAACGLLAESADLATTRRLRVLAVGLAEAAGAAYTGALQLRLLAAAELAAGEPHRCLAHLGHALRRLDGVLLLGARLERGRCHELAADALAAAGDPEAARASLDAAAAAFDHPDLGAAHRVRVATRRAALG